MVCISTAAVVVVASNDPYGPVVVTCDDPGCNTRVEGGCMYGPHDDGVYITKPPMTKYNVHDFHQRSIANDIKNWL